MSRYPMPAASPQKPHCSELLVRRSRFLAQSAHSPGPDAARSFVEAVRRAHPDASHNCWAFVAGPPGHSARIGSSDDGEPHGTAGRPMLQLLLHCGLGEICVVVSRWFGGIKLGTGGLVRAYQDSVRENLAGLAQAERVSLCSLALEVDYAHLDALRRLLPVCEAKMTYEKYQEKAVLHIELPEEQRAFFEKALSDASNGKSVSRLM